MLVAGLAAGWLMPGCSSQTNARPEAGQGELQDADADPGESAEGGECGLVLLTLTPGPDPCRYTSAKKPLVPSNVRVRIDGTTIVEDAANGWHYGADTQSIIFTGDSCDVVLKGAAAMTPPRAPVVTLVIGCPPGGPIP